MRAKHAPGNVGRRQTSTCCCAHFCSCEPPCLHCFAQPPLLARPLQEVHTLLSAAAVALSHVRVTWPLLVPVHDAVRDGYRGVSVSACGATLHFDSDSLHSSRLRPGLLGLKQQLLLFARQLGAAGAPAAAAACRTAAGAELELPASMAADAAAGGSGRPCPAAGGGHHVALAVRHSYALAEPGEADEGGGGGAGPEDERHACEGGTGDWDERAPWRPWAAQADPIGGPSCCSVGPGVARTCQSPVAEHACHRCRVQALNPAGRRPW